MESSVAPPWALDLEFARATEQAALAAWRWFGRGDKNAADLAAVEALRKRFQTIDCQGLVRIGEGLKDDAPGIFTGDRLGRWHPDSAPVAIALDPIDGTTLTAKGLPGAISVLAVAICESTDDDPLQKFPAISSHYMQKLAVGPAVASCGPPLDLDVPLQTTLASVAKALDKRVTDLVAVVLDRPRHQHLIENLRALGCGIRLITDGDIVAAIAPSLPNSGVDLYVGIGGSPEAVISAAAIKSLGGEQHCRIWVNNEVERMELLRNDNLHSDDLKRVWVVDEMACGDNIVFVATGISDSTMLRGVQKQMQRMITHSLLISSRSKGVRFMDTYHDVNEAFSTSKPQCRDVATNGAASLV